MKIIYFLWILRLINNIPIYYNISKNIKYCIFTFSKKEAQYKYKIFKNKDMPENFDFKLEIYEEDKEEYISNNLYNKLEGNVLLGKDDISENNKICFLSDKSNFQISFAYDQIVIKEEIIKEKEKEFLIKKSEKDLEFISNINDNLIKMKYMSRYVNKFEKSKLETITKINIFEIVIILFLFTIELIIVNRYLNKGNRNII